MSSLNGNPAFPSAQNGHGYGYGYGSGPPALFMEKVNNHGSLEAPLRKPRPARQVKALGSDSVSDASAPFSLSKMTKERNPRTALITNSL
ncbi:hypothetical protein SDJN02_11289, partial [Cucurbita argyrosperma subsp. argyrosperma]